MAEDFEERKSEGFEFSQIAGIVRRRRWHFLIPLFLGWLIVWCASWQLPSVYKSQTTIIVLQPTVSKDLVPSNVNDNLQDRLQSITQQILSRTRLVHIIEQLDPYGSEHTKRSPDEQVDRMRKDINIELVRDIHNQITAFNVYYTSGNPYTAQKVAGKRFREVLITNF